MDHAMPDGLNVGGAANFLNTRFVGSYVSDQVIERCGVITEGCSEFLLGFVFRLKGDDRLAACALNFALADSLVSVLLDPLQVGCNDLELQARASGIEDENVHANPCGQYRISGARTR